MGKCLGHLFSLCHIFFPPQVVDSQASSFPVPIGMRPVDLEDDLGMDLDLDEDEASFEAGSFDESGQDGERSMPESESVPAEEDEAWHFLDPTSDEEEARNEHSVQSDEY